VETHPSAAAPRFPPAARVLLAAGGLLLLALAALANYSNAYIFADNWPAPNGHPTLFIHLPGMAERQYRFFPLWWLLAGLPAALLGIGLLSRRFRHALAAPWRSLATALPLAATLAVLIFTLLPWDWPNAKPHETGSALTLYLYLATSGFILLVIGLWPVLRVCDRPAQALAGRFLQTNRTTFLLLTAGFSFLVSALISSLVFERMPHVQDSVAQLFQARIFASGRLFLQSPRFADFFDYTHIINNGRWYSQYPFLHSLVLLPGVLVRQPWLINPLIGALTVPFLYLLGRELYDERTGRLTALLACFTPFILNMSAEYMNHTTTLLLVLLFMLFYSRGLFIGNCQLPIGNWKSNAVRREPVRPLPGLLAGLFLGLAANVRPYTAAAVALPFGLHALFLALRRPRQVLPFLIPLALAAGAGFSLTLLYNQLTNGHPLLFGYVVKWGPGHEIGFGHSGWGAQHTPLRGLLNTGNDFNLLNKFLFEWPLPALLPAAILFAAGTRDRRDWLLLTSFLCLAGAYFFYWFHNVCFGPRFLYESSAALLLLTVRGLFTLGPLLRRTFQVPLADGTPARLLGRVLPLLLLVMAGVGLPPLYRLYHTYGGVDASVQRAVRRAGLANALVFCAHFGAGFSANSLGLDGPVVYARDYGILNSALTLAYPGRQCFFASRDTLRLLPDIQFSNSRLRRTLDDLARFARDSADLNGYSTVIWPFRDIPPDLGVRSLKLTDYREISRAIFAGRGQLQDELPALAGWVLGDGREHLQVFAFMDELQNFLAGDVKFTLVHVTADGTAALYDVRRTTGRELVVPDQRQP